MVLYPHYYSNSLRPRDVVVIEGVLLVFVQLEVIDSGGVWH